MQTYHPLPLVPDLPFAPSWARRPQIALAPAPLGAGFFPPPAHVWGEAEPWHSTNDRAIVGTMSKGEATRQAVLEQAVSTAAHSGLAGLTIGSLATQTGMS